MSLVFDILHKQQNQNQLTEARLLATALYISMQRKNNIRFSKPFDCNRPRFPYSLDKDGSKDKYPNDKAHS